MLAIYGLLISHPQTPALEKLGSYDGICETDTCAIV